ncbi:hypothetical protein J1N35_000816 [Gossypium stocksii]|uniref:Transposase MuDR plant domain-containing protein n=1 Tax=Gossypium stocksii TaxID=47602 RepID=A0A9D4AL47_9ROSI|nr:hypothetical protein J1N35_000816 [Gossypium stocksii]
MFNAGKTYRGMISSSNSWQPIVDFGCFDNYIRRDDVLPTTSTVEGTSNLGDVGGVENEKGIDFDADPIQEPDVEGPGENAKEDPRFYSPLAHMHNVDLSVEDALEFVKLPHRRLDHASSSLDSGDLEVGKEFSSKDHFVAIVKRYNIRMGYTFTLLSI